MNISGGMSAREKVSERLKVARSLAGFINRKDFCAHFAIPYDTLNAWERGRNPLTLKGAKRIVEILKSAGMYCSEDWLMTGEGLSPRPLKETLVEEMISPALILDNPSVSLGSLEKNLNIATEISTFTTLNKDSIITIIKDDAMLPFYEQGDYVGGIKLNGKDWSEAVSKRCIVEYSEGQIGVGQFQKSADSSVNKASYEVCPLNKSAQLSSLIDSSLEIVSVAPILWHRTFPKTKAT